MELFFTFIVPIAAEVLIAFLVIRIASHTFLCRECGKKFRITPLRVLFTEHSDKEYLLVCPHCKKKGWCEEMAPKKGKRG